MRNSKATKHIYSLVAAVICCGAATETTAQEGVRNARAIQTAAQSRQLQLESMDYTVRSGDFRLLLSPSVGLDYSDNINGADDNAEDDFIFRPTLRASMSHPVTQRNLLVLNVGVGYDDYLENNEYDTWRLSSGTQLSFDVYIKDLRINLHDFVSYTQDGSQEPSIAGEGTGRFGNINNTAGVLLNYALRDVSFSAGFDHQNVWSQEDVFRSQNRATEIFSSSVAYLVNRVLTAGVEATAAFTSYDDPILNDNTSYSAGLFGTYRPGLALTVTPRVGYALYQFDDTSRILRTGDADSWYFDVTANHAITEVISYSLSLGHEMRLGVQSDLTEEWYVRPSVRWGIFKNLSLTTFASYQHGSQGQENIEGNLSEEYDWISAGLGAQWPFAKRFSLGMHYRYTLRLSDLENRDYQQNMVGLLLTYR